MLDAQLLSAAIADRRAWERIAPHFKPDEMSPQGAVWYKLIAAWYQRDPQAQRIDKSLLMEQGETQLKPKQREPVMAFMRDLPEPASAENTAQVALELKRYNTGMELGAAIASHDYKKVAEILPIFNELQAATALQDKRRTEWEDALPVEQLFDKVGHENRIPLAPRILNDRIDGGALPGHHVVVFGRPEAGKSTFAINMAGSLVRRGQRVLYVGNEDRIHILKTRMLSRITGMTFKEAEQDREKATRMFRERGGEDNLLMSQLKHGTVDAVRKKVEEFQPTVLVLDQIRGLEGDEDGLTRQLERNAKLVRDLLNDHELIGVSVTQANERTQHYGQEPPTWLGMGDVDSSRTGLPGQADLLIGLGSNAELRMRNQRAVSIPKNKLSSELNAHEGFYVEIDVSRAHIR